jgi:hypothetical protein
VEFCDRKEGGALKRNITLSLEEDLLKKAKLVAEKKEMSVSGLLTEQLTRVIMEEDQYEASLAVSTLTIEGRTSSRRTHSCNTGRAS